MTSLQVIRFESVDFDWWPHRILSGINFRVHTGERWAIIGPNGAGKSTILSLCGATNQPTRGIVEILGFRLGRVDIRELRKSIGHVNPQHPVPAALTIRDVVLTGATGSINLVPRWQPSRATLKRANSLLYTVGLYDSCDATWATLSQGERARTLIARSLLPDPPLLLLDEATVGLDVASRERLLGIIDGLNDINPSLATIMITHHLEELPESTTHAMLVKAGKIMTMGRAEEVLTTDNISHCFDYPIAIEYRSGRWIARSGQIAET